MKAFGILGLSAAAPVLAVAALLGGLARAEAPRATQAALTRPAAGQIVALRRLSEAQYRNAIADIFGSDIKVAGRFEPIVRPPHQMLMTGASLAAISPAGMEQLEIVGRSVAAQVFDDAHRANFMRCKPADHTAADAACTRSTLASIGRYVFRRPLDPAELDQYAAIAATGPTRLKSFNVGMQLALAAMLVSPNFLYVVETAEADPDRPGEARLDAYSRASRLSFLLWNTTPNARLLDAAQSGALMSETSLKATAAAMVASPRFENTVRAFFADMLMFEKFDDLAKDPVIYPRFTAEVSRALPEQMLRTIVDHLLARNGDYRDLFITRRTFMTRGLGPLYGVAVPGTGGWVPYDFPASDERAGLLGQAGFLAIYAHSGRSSPTLRGRAIRELLMCQPVPDPPGNVNFTAVQETANRAMPTARIRLSSHNDNPVCAGCHKITDPIGLTLERFDGIGMFRSAENGAAIDVSGAIDGQSFAGAGSLGKVVAANNATTQCLAGRALEYATGRPIDAEEALVAAVEQRFSANGYNVRDLFLNVATLPQAYVVRRPDLERGPHTISMLTK